MTTSSLQVTWSISPLVVDLRGFTTNSAIVPRGHLQLGSVYTISVSVSVSSDESKWSNASVTVGVKRTSLQAVISSSHLVVGDQTPFTLDGALSFDPSNAAGDLQLLWSCSDLMTSNTSCLGPNLLVNSKVLTVPAGALHPETYLFTLKVFKDYRSAETQTSVIIRQGELPIVYIKKRKAGRVDPTQRLVVEGYVTSRANVTIRWEVVVAKEYALPLIDGVTSSVVPRYYSFSLVDRPFPLLIPATNQWWAGLLGGALYKIRLIAEPMDGGESGYAEVIIETNNPPDGGTLQIEPLSGYALSTNFTLDARGSWRDSPQDYSLSYAFSFRLSNSDVDILVTKIMGAPPVVRNVILPGVLGQTTEVIVKVKTCDIWDSCRIAEKAVSIETFSTFSADDFDSINKTVVQYLNQGDQTRALSIATAVALTLGNDQYGDLGNSSQVLFQDVLDRMIENYLSILGVKSTSAVLTNDVLSLMAVVQMTIQPTSLRDVTKRILADLMFSLLYPQSESTSSNYTPMRRLLSSKESLLRGKRQTELHVLPMDPAQVSVMLGMDAMITSADPSPSTVENLFNSINTYLSGMCQHLVVGEDPAIIWTNLAALRSEKLEFDYIAGQNLTLAHLDKGPTDQRMLLRKDIVNTYRMWSCDSDVCYGACIGSAEVALATAIVIGGSSLLSPLLQVQFFNPRTGEQMIVEDLLFPLTVTVQVEKVEIRSGQVLQCGLFNLATRSWNTDTCVTSNLDINTGTLTCECTALGYFGVIAQDAPTTVETSTFVTMEDVETQRTTSEPTWITIPSTTNVLTTTIPTTTTVPMTSVEQTTTKIPTSTSERTTTIISITANEFTTTAVPTTTDAFTTTPVPRTTNEFITTAVSTTTNAYTTTAVSTTTNEFTTTAVSTTTNEFTTTAVPTTTNEFTTTAVPTTTNEFTTTAVPTITNEFTTTAISTTTVKPTTTEVLTTTQPPDAPRPIKARFTDSLDNVLIMLSDSVRPEGLVNCSDVFNQSSLKLLGEDPTCISIANTLTIQLGREPELIPYDVLTFLLGNGLYNRDVPPELGLEAIGTVTVEEAVSPFTPYFELFGLAEVCGGNINITAHDVTADACHELDYFRTIYPTNTSDASIYFGLHDVQRKMSQQDSTGDPKRVTFSTDQLKEDIDYVVIITATNRFGGESYLPSIHRFRRTNKPLALTIQGPTVVDAQRDVTFTVIVGICEEMDMTTSTLQFIWSITPSVVDLSGFSGNTATVPKGNLQLGSAYTISVRVSVSSDESKWSNASVTTGVKRTSLQAVISSSHLVVGDQTPFTLDGALSFDPSNAAGDLQLLWSCSDLVTTNTSCFGTSQLVNDQILAVPARSLLPNTYFITLKVSKGDRYAETQTTVTIRQGELPVVYIKSKKAGRINPNERLVVEGFVTSRANVTIYWEVVVDKEYSLPSLNGVTSSVVPRYYSSSLVDRPFPLLIPAVNERWTGLLSGALYKFRLTANPLDGGEPGFADVAIESNKPPVGGRFEVEPTSGFPLTTSFTLDATEGWVDYPLDYSLSYAFSYRLNRNDVDTPIATITGAPPLVENVILPEGQTSEVIVQVKVCDVLNSCTTTKRTVSTQPLSSFLTSDFDNLNKTVVQYLNQGDQIRALSVARATVLTLNSEQYGEFIVRSQTLFQDVVDNMAESYSIGLGVESIRSSLTNDILSLMEITQLTIQPNYLREATQNNLKDLTVLLVQTLSMTNTISSGPMRRLLSLNERTSRTKRQSELYALPIAPRQVNVMLGMDTMITSADPSPSTVENLFNSINTYLSGMCQHLVVGEDPAIIWTNLAALRSEKLEFDMLTDGGLTLASLDNSQNNHWIFLGNDIINSYQRWSCDSVICYGACVGSAEFALEIATVIGGSVLLGPLSQVQLFNPRTGQQMFVEDLLSPVRVTVQVEKIEIDDGQVLMCGIFDLLSKSWNTDVCVTEKFNPDSRLLTCECYALGYIGAIEHEAPTTRILTTVYTTEGLFDVETEKTTDEPTTTQLPTSTSELITTQLPTSVGEPTTTQLPSSTGEPTTTQLPTSTDEPTTTQLPTRTDEPTTTQLPTSTGEPTTTQLPTITGESTTTQVLVNLPPHNYLRLTVELPLQRSYPQR
ncbi:uncharacterized protein LOC143237318 [Tachypleus tridentatus]|uniref:uncharacterized protein LOC143237318 n=1 Tax=Tachypleus tridentatus TaxID=6853 RepID=UPI003FD240A4